MCSSPQLDCGHSWWLHEIAKATLVAALLVLFATRAPCEEILAEFDVSPRGDLLAIPVTIDARDYPFVLDTGTSRWVFDDSLRRQLGPLIGFATVDAGRDNTVAPRYAMRATRIHGFDAVAPNGAICAEIRDLMSTSGRDVYGLSGTDFLRQKIFRVDFDRGKVQFIREPGAGAGERFGVHWKGDTPYLSVDIAGATEEFLVDTGHCCLESGELRMPLYIDLLAAGKLELIDGVEVGRSSPIGKNETDHLARLATFTVGPFAHDGLIFGHSTKNVLGLGYLSRYVATFDLSHSALYLKPGRGYRKRDRYPLGGVELSNIDDKTVIQEIDEGGPVARSGLRVADELLEVDGVSAASISIFELRRMFATPGERRIRFARDAIGRSRIHEVTAVLTDHDMTQSGKGN